MAIPPRQPLGEPFTVGRFVQDFDASDYERPRREVRVTPNVVRAKGA